MSSTDQYFAPTEKIVQAGSYDLWYVEILKANGNGIDVREQVEKITIYEDMYSPFITGKITFRDTYDIPSLIGRSGRDILHIRLSNPILADSRHEFSGYFFIYKFGDRELVRDRTQMYNMYFMSIDGMTDLHTPVSRAFSGSADSIVKKICDDILKTEKNLTVDKSRESIKYVSNFWSASKNMMFLSRHARAENDDSSFVFFENRYGYNFRTISGMAGEQPIQRFLTNDYSIDINTTETQGKIHSPHFGESTRNPIKDYTVVQGSYRVKNMFDYMDAYQNGGIKSKMTTYDVVRKKIDYPTYAMPKEGILNPNSMYTPAVIDAAPPIRMSMLKHFSSSGLPTNSTNSGWIQARIAELKMLSASVIEIDVYGRLDYTVGKKIYLSVNATMPIDLTTDPLKSEDKNYSGFYLITAVVHTFDRKAHMATIELSKESTINS